MKKNINRITSLILVLVLALGMLPAAVLTATAATQTVSGTVNASAIPAGSDVVLNGNTTLNMNVARQFRSVSGSYDLTVQGAGELAVVNNGGAAVSVRRLYCYSDLRAESTGSHAIEVNSWCEITNASTRVIAGEDGIKYSLQSGSLRINSAELYMIAGRHGINSNTGVQLEGGRIGVIAENGRGIWSDSPFSVDITCDSLNVLAYKDGIYAPNASLSVTCGEASVDAYTGNGLLSKNKMELYGSFTVNAPEGDAIYCNTKDIELKDSVIEVTAGKNGVYAKNGSVFAENCLLYLENVGSGKYSLYAKGRIELTGCELTYRDTRAYDGISVSGDMGYVLPVGKLQGNDDYRDVLVMNYLVRAAWKFRDFNGSLKRDDIKWYYLMKPSDMPRHVIKSDGLRGVFQLESSAAKPAAGDKLTFRAVPKHSNYSYVLQSAGSDRVFSDVCAIAPGGSYVLKQSDIGKVFRVKISGKGFGETYTTVSVKYDSGTLEYSDFIDYSAWDIINFWVHYENAAATNTYTQVVDCGVEPVIVSIPSYAVYGDKMNVEITGNAAAISIFKTEVSDDRINWTYFEPYQIIREYRKINVASFQHGVQLNNRYIRVAAVLESGEIYYSNPCYVYPDYSSSDFIIVGEPDYACVNDMLEVKSKVVDSIPDNAIIVWQRRTPKNHDAWEDIPGSAGAFYRVTPDDLDYSIRPRIVVPELGGFAGGACKVIQRYFFGEVSFTADFQVGKTIVPVLSGEIASIPESWLQYNWVIYEEGKTRTISETRTYTPTAVDVGSKITLKVTLKGASNTLFPSPKTVQKGQNTGYPVAPVLSKAAPYNYVTVTNVKSDQEYIVTDSPNPPADWSGAGYRYDESDLQLPAQRNALVYVHTRFRPTSAWEAGTKTAKAYIVNRGDKSLSGVALYAARVQKSASSPVRFDLQGLSEDLTWRESTAASQYTASVSSLLTFDSAM